MHPPTPHLAVSPQTIYPSSPLLNCCLPCPAALSIHKKKNPFFFFACVLHPMIQRGGELMRPGFLERFVLNCPFCRFNDLAVSCHISQVPVVSVAGLAGATTIRSLWGRVALESPRQGLDACCAPELDGKHFPELFPVIIPSSSCCFVVPGSLSTPQCQPQYEKSLYAHKIPVQQLPSFFLRQCLPTNPP